MTSSRRLPASRPKGMTTDKTAANSGPRDSDDVISTDGKAVPAVIRAQISEYDRHKQKQVPNLMSKLPSQDKSRRHVPWDTFHDVIYPYTNNTALQMKIETDIEAHDRLNVEKQDSERKGFNEYASLPRQQTIFGDSAFPSFEPNKESENVLAIPKSREAVVQGHFVEFRSKDIYNFELKRINGKICDANIRKRESEPEAEEPRDSEQTDAEAGSATVN